MAIKTLPLKGYKALKALNGFHALLFGLKMLPSYLAISYETFYASFKTKTPSEKETYLREAVAFVSLNQEEVEAIVTFATDKNGISYQSANVINLPLDELYEITVAVCMEIGRINIDIVSQDEKKNLNISPLMSVNSS